MSSLSRSTIRWVRQLGVSRPPLSGAGIGHHAGRCPHRSNVEVTVVAKEALAMLICAAYRYLPTLGNRNALTDGPVVMDNPERVLQPSAAAHALGCLD